MYLSPELAQRMNLSASGTHRVRMTRTPKCNLSTVSYVVFCEPSSFAGSLPCPSLRLALENSPTLGHYQFSL